MIFRDRIEVIHHLKSRGLAQIIDSAHIHQQVKLKFWTLLRELEQGKKIFTLHENRFIPILLVGIGDGVPPAGFEDVDDFSHGTNASPPSSAKQRGLSAQADKRGLRGRWFDGLTMIGTE